MRMVNWQWAITDQALEAAANATSDRVVGITSEYTIHLDRLLETAERSGGILYDWPAHMAEKTWVDIDAFNEAFVQAIRYQFGDEMKGVDRAMLEASLELGRRIGEKTRRGG